MRILTASLIIGIGITWWIWREKPVPYIPLEKLFCQPIKVKPELSPDGNTMAYLAQGTTPAMNIWIDDRMITNVTERSIRHCRWETNNTLLYLRDNNGNENWRLYRVTLDGKTICLTPYDTVQARLLLNRSNIIALNKNNPSLHDLYKIDGDNLILIQVNPGYISQWGSEDTALQETDDGGKKLLLYKNEWQPIRTYSPEESRCCSIAHVTPTTIYMLENKGVNTVRLIAIDKPTLTIQVIAENPTFDISQVQVNTTTNEIEAVMVNEVKPTWHLIKPGLAQRILAACAHFDGIIHFDLSSPRAIVCIETDTSLPTYYIYDDPSQTLTKLFTAYPAIPDCFAPIKPISFTARDGLTLTGYLTIPLNKKPSALPLLLMVHGGPWLRDSWGYMPEVQWLVNRGYAVLQINYRGSQGFGKEFLNKGNKQWGGKMIDDLIDGVQWAIDNNIADPHKIGIYGASYGGYATLMAAATSDLFCCGIDAMGISNLFTLFNSIPPYWEVYRQWLYKAIGNPDTEPDLLREHSPLFKASSIKIPLLICQGANDPRVPMQEAEQLVAALQENNIPHEYLLFENEGHFLSHEENRYTFYRQAEKFLARHLGGRAF